MSFVSLSSIVEYYETLNSRFALEHRYIKLKDDKKTSTKSKEFIIFTSGLALVGFYWQLSNGFSLPFPLNFFLLPVTVLESVLGYFVAK